MKLQKLAFPGDLFRQGGCADSHVPAARTHGFWQRTCAEDTAKLQSYAWLRSHQHLLLELEVSMSGCQDHIIALCLIWIYQSTELNAAREKDFGSDEVFSFLGRINKRPLPLFSVSKLQWREKNAWNISISLLSWHHLYRRSSVSMAACPLTRLCARAWHMSQPNIGHGLQNDEPATAFQ